MPPAAGKGSGRNRESVSGRGLEGGTDREKAVFAQALEDMLRPIENQRYLLIYGRNWENL